MGHEPESRLQGLFREYLDKNRAELHDTYEKSFALFRRADRLLLDVMADIQKHDIQKETPAACGCRVLCLRFYKAMRAAFLLIENDCTVEAFTCVRNMLECYLALACLLKEEKVFFEIIEQDLYKAREGIYKHADTTTKIRRALDPDAIKLINEKRKQFKDLKDSGKTFQQSGAYQFYQLTQDEPDNGYIYFLYRIISNSYSHISSHSLSIDICDEKDDLRWVGISKGDMKSFTKYVIEAFSVFTSRLDTCFLNDKYEAEVNDILTTSTDLVESLA